MCVLSPSGFTRLSLIALSLARVRDIMADDI